MGVSPEVHANRPHHNENNMQYFVALPPLTPVQCPFLLSPNTANYY